MTARLPAILAQRLHVQTAVLLSPVVQAGVHRHRGSTVSGSLQPASATPSDAHTDARHLATGPSGLRILTVMNCYRDTANGMPVANGLLSSELRRLGHAVENLYLDDLPGWVARKGVNYALFGPLVTSRIRRIEKDTTPFDVVQISGGDGYLAEPLRRDRLGRRRLIVARSHGLEHLYWGAYLQEVSRGYERCSLAHRLNFGGLRLWEVERTIRAADLLVCHSTQELDYVVTKGWKETSQVAITSSGVPTEWLQLGLEPLPTNRILWSGSWVWMKGKRVLVDVFSALARENQHLQLTIVGTGIDAELVLADFPPPLRSRVEVRRSVPHAEMPSLFRSHSLLLATSLYEGFGGVVVEAMAAGLPVIASTAGAWPQFVQSGRTGVLVDGWGSDGFTRACRWLLEMPEVELSLIRSQAKLAVSHLTWSGQAAALAKRYEGALRRLTP